MIFCTGEIDFDEFLAMMAKKLKETDLGKPKIREKSCHSEQVLNNIPVNLSFDSFHGYLQRRISERLSECLITRILGKMF